MGRSESDCKCFEIEPCSGEHCKEVEVEYTVHYYLERGYGADADGNRGVDMWFIDDWEYSIPEECVDHTKLTPAEKERCRVKIEKFLEDL